MRRNKVSFLIAFAGICFSLLPLAAQQAQTVVATVANISKYGNLEMDIKPSAELSGGYAYGDVLNISVGGQIITAPLCTSYSDVDTGKPLVRVDNANDILIVAINMGNFAKTYKVAVGDKVTFSLKQKGAYLSEYLLRQLKRTNNRSDYATDSIFANFRNITLGSIAPGVLYRSSSPVNNELGRAAYADSLADAFKIATVVNLADSDAKVKEFIAAPGFNSPYYKSLYEGGHVKALDMGVDLVSDAFGKKLVEGMRFIINNNGPYLLHCTEGKDRAGFTSAVLEGLMGASLDDIVADYMLTYQNYYKVEKGSDQYNAIARSNIITSISLLMGYKQAADLSGVDLAKAAEAYLMKFGLSADEVAALKAKLSTPIAAQSLSLSGTITGIEKYGHTVTDIKIADFNKAGFKLGDMVTVTYGNGFVLEAPYLDGYYVDNGMPLVRAYPGQDYIAVCINYGKIFQVADVAVGDKVTIKLSRKGGYLDQYSVRSLKRTNNRADYVSDSVFANFRTITIGDIDAHILYRSSSPVNPELGRAAYADKLAKANGIATVVNLADTKEEVDKFIAADGFNSPYYAGLYKDGKVATLGMDLAYNGDAFRKGVAQAGKFMVANKPPYLIHCTEGKDRAGFVSAMLEALMNGTVDQIVADYMTSYSNYYGVAPGTEKYQVISKDVLTMLKTIAGVDDLSKADLSAAVKAYLISGGMTSAEVDQLKAVLSGTTMKTVSAAPVRTYVVVKGDTLWDLSYKFLGTGFRYGEIYKANEKDVKTPGLIYVGQILVIPAK